MKQLFLFMGPYANHPQHCMRNPCETVLLKTIELAGGKTFLSPNFNILLLLQVLLNRPNFYESCESWRSREIREKVLSDIYDGKV